MVATTAAIYLDTGTEILQLLGSLHGINLAHDGWQRAIARRGNNGKWPDSVIETMMLRVDGDSADDLASKVQALDEMIVSIGNSSAQDFVYSDVYLHTRMPGEIFIYRTQAISATTQLRSHMFSPPASTQFFVRELILSIERTPFWEPERSTSVALQTASLLGGAIDFSATSGDVPARIGKMALTSSVSVSTPITEFWMGFRSQRMGSLSLFRSVWECEKAGTLGANTSITGDSTASDSSKLTCALPSSAALALRAEGDLIEFVPDYPSAQRGLYQVLLRAKATGTRTYQVRLRSGYGNANIWYTHSRVTVSGTDWKLYPMGTVRIPSDILQGVAAPNFLYFSLALDAGELSSGTGNLDLDCFVVIPKAEGFCYINSVYSSSTSSSTLATTARDKMMAWGNHSDAGIGEVQQEQFELPHDVSSKLIVAGQTATAHDKDHNAFISVDYFPRWLTLRGSE